MIDPKAKILQELSEYVQMEEHLNKQDRLLMLTAIFEKAFIFEKTLHLITEHDILNIASMCKTSYSNLSLPLQVGRKMMGYDDLRTIANIEALISYMNQNHLNRKEIQINYKRSK